MKRVFELLSISVNSKYLLIKNFLGSASLLNMMF